MHRGKRYRRSAGTENIKAVEAQQGQINLRLQQLRQGLVTLPAGVSIKDFLLYGTTSI